MYDVQILTLPFSPGRQWFDCEAMRVYLKTRKLVRAEPHFFVYEGQPYWTVWLETRALLGRLEVPAQAVEVAALASAPLSASAPAGAPAPLGGGDTRKMEREQLWAKVRALSEQERATFERLRQWRGQRAEQEGVPPYLVLTNQQVLELARQPPRTLAALGQLPGIGKKRIEKYGKTLLEVLHGRSFPSSPTSGDGAAPALDGDHPVVAGADSALPASPAPDAEPAD